jgi:phage shock protein A
MNIIEIIVLVSILIGSLAYIFKGSSFSNRVRSLVDGVDKKVADPETDATYAIKDASEEVNHFENDIAALMTANRGIQKRKDAAQLEVDKFTGIATKARDAGNVEDATEAYNLMVKAKTNLDSLSKQIAANNTLLGTLRSQLDKYHNDISNAEDNKARLVVAQRSAALRKKVAQSAAGIGTGRGLAALGKLQDAVEQSESEADTYEELASTSTTGKGTRLESKYGEANTSGLDAFLNAKAK